MWTVVYNGAGVGDTLLGDATPDWTPSRRGVDPSEFARGSVGPYRLGRTVRTTDLGEVRLALSDAFEEIMEVECLAALAGTALAGPEGTLLADIAPVVGLRHRHLATVAGAGIADGVPYLVRVHRPGRTLFELLEREARAAASLGPAVLFAVVEALAFLAEEGGAAGACALGGFDARDVLLGFDGGPCLLGTGLRRVRAGGRDPILADLESARRLAELFDETSEVRLDLAALAAAAGSASDLAAHLRRAHREACARMHETVGSVLRAHFGDDIQRERAFFGMATLH